MVKLGDREALLREREEKRRVSGWGGRTVMGTGAVGALPCEGSRVGPSVCGRQKEA